MSYNSSYKDYYNKQKYGSCCEKGDKGEPGEPGIPGPPGKDGTLSGGITPNISLNMIDTITIMMMQWR